MKLRPYQRRLVSAVSKEIAAGTPEIVLAAAPGAGKTEMAFAIIRRVLAKRLASRVLVLAHGTTVLRRQFAERAVVELGAEMVHEHVRGRKPPASGAVVIVALPQSLHRRENLLACDLVIVDEAHEFYDAEMAKRVIRKVGAKSVVLLTGSPSRFIARGLPLHSFSLHQIMKECPGAVCDPAIDLVASEFLIPYDRFNHDGEVKKDVRFGRAATKATLDGLLEKMVAHLPRRRGRAVSGWQATIAEMGKTIVACRSLALARQVASYFRDRGVNAGLSTHKDDLGSEEIQRFKDDATMALLIVVRRGVLGFNFPELLNLVDMTGTINIDRIFQMFARVVRPHPTRPKTRKLFVKMTPKGKMEGYTKDVMSAALQLGRKETFETFNGGNLDGVVIPRWRGDDEGAVARNPRGAVSPNKLRPLAKCFLASDFFEAVSSMDQEFSPYARTTLNESRRGLLGLDHIGNPCSFVGCGKPNRSRGLCGTHAAQRDRGDEPHAVVSKAARGTRSFCVFPVCGGIVEAHGLCAAHDRQKRFGRELRPVHRTNYGAVCSFDGCGRRHASKGLCSGHWGQQRSGRMLGPLRPKSVAGRVCGFMDCGRRVVAKGFCNAHWIQSRSGRPLRPTKRMGLSHG